MSSLLSISDETRNAIRKFRLTTNRINKPEHIILQISSEQELLVDTGNDSVEDSDDGWSDSDDEDEIEDIKDIRKQLPSNQPRFVVLAYPYKNKIPLILIYYKPDTCRDEETRMLYVNGLEFISKNNLVSPNKIIDLVDKDDLKKEFIENEL
ncbi:uncharacterized protein HGUI_00325 [Hanseniaspora guilliermondii]|uniref:ADF-H domain-containing protein n=1 Tax=Hanseniaspora guilliermondii TaxID=56406 RepID=A0A1L0CHA2_9ASCO|nr:uncharacterized protein HGUI_00325 [Hanseniaspora guilliermondii]